MVYVGTVSVHTMWRIIYAVCSVRHRPKYSRACRSRYLVSSGTYTLYAATVRVDLLCVRHLAYNLLRLAYGVRWIRLCVRNAAFNSRPRVAYGVTGTDYMYTMRRIIDAGWRMV